LVAGSGNRTCKYTRMLAFTGLHQLDGRLGGQGPYRTDSHPLCHPVSCILYCPQVGDFGEAKWMPELIDRSAARVPHLFVFLSLEFRTPVGGARAHLSLVWLLICFSVSASCTSSPLLWFRPGDTAVGYGNMLRWTRVAGAC
jgi:hypothetical protein